MALRSKQSLLRLLWAPEASGEVAYLMSEEAFEIQLGAEVLVNVAKIISPDVFCKLELDVKGSKATFKAIGNCPWAGEGEVARRGGRLFPSCSSRWSSTAPNLTQRDSRSLSRLYVGKAMSVEDVS